MKKLLLLISTLLFSSMAFAATGSEVVQFDTTQIPTQEIEFAATMSSARPAVSKFGVTYHAFLSNELGERFAIATFINLSSSSTKLNTRDVVGVLASGERIYPIQIEGEQRIDGKGTLLLHFDTQKFPLIKLETRN